MVKLRLGQLVSCSLQDHFFCKRDVKGGWAYERGQWLFFFFFFTIFARQQQIMETNRKITSQIQLQLCFNRLLLPMNFQSWAVNLIVIELSIWPRAISQLQKSRFFVKRWNASQNVIMIKVLCYYRDAKETISIWICLHFISPDFLSSCNDSTSLWNALSWLHRLWNSKRSLTNIPSRPLGWHPDCS